MPGTSARPQLSLLAAGSLARGLPLSRDAITFSASLPVRVVNATIALLALLTGLLSGAVFSYLQVPIPAPPTLSGLLGIVGIYLGYKLVEALGWGFDLLEALGL